MTSPDWIQRKMPPTSLFSMVEEQSKLTVEIAQKITKENDINVFVIEKPPRYDPDNSDPTSMKQKLSKYSNGVLASTVGPTPRIFIVEQAGLARSHPKARADIFQSDGLHLTPKGLKLYTNKLIIAMNECYGEATKPSVILGSSGTGSSQGIETREVGDRRQSNGRDQGDASQEYQWQVPPYGGAWGWPPRHGGPQGYRPQPYPGFRGNGGGQKKGGGYKQDYWDYNGRGGYGGGYNDKQGRRWY